MSPVYGSVVINGVKDTNILSIIRSQITSTGVKISKSDPDLVKAKCKEDLSIIKDILYSLGYFDCEVKYYVSGDKIFFSIQPNERYRLSKISIIYKDRKNFSSGLTVKDAFDLIGKKKGSYTNTVEIDKSVEKIRKFFKESGYAFVDIKTPILKPNRETKECTVIYTVKLNSKIIINNTKLEIKPWNSAKNQKGSMDSFIRNRIAWKKGSTYDIRDLDKTKDKLLNSDIFKLVEISVEKPKKVDWTEQSYCDVTIHAEEAPPRSLNAGITFDSTEKLGGNFSWTHYNVDGAGSKFSTGIKRTGMGDEAIAKHTSYDVFGENQKWKNELAFYNEHVPAYDSKKVLLRSMLWRATSETTSLGSGLGIERTITDDKTTPKTGEENSKSITAFWTVSIPLGLNLDTTNSYIDPQSGVTLKLLLTPNLGCNIEHFIVLKGEMCVYIPIVFDKFYNKFISVFYTKFGGIIDKGGTIPRDNLFFSSIRGYGYQSVGKLDSNGIPLGGKSIFEIGAEQRVKVSDNLWIKIFVEGGSVYDSGFPVFPKNSMWGVGLGATYYISSSLPITIWIGFPMKRRKIHENKRIDKAFTFNLEIGSSYH
jgi:translocation and assembly module TamA